MYSSDAVVEFRPSILKQVRRVVFLGALALVVATSTEARELRVLLLQSADRGNLGLDTFSANLRLALDERFAQPLTFVQFVVTPSGYTAAPEAAVLEFVRSASVNQPKPDLVVTVGGLAAVFAKKNRAQLFPDSPLLLAATDRRFIDSAPLGDNETTVAVDNNGSGIVDDILRVLPQTSTVFVVISSGEQGAFWRQQLDREFARFRGRVTFEWFVGRTFKEIVRRVSMLPPGRAILYLTFGQDGKGGAYADEQALEQLHAAANAPIFGTQSSALGHGVVGGTLMSIDQLTATATDVAFRLLNGESPSRVRPPVQRPGPPVFDWRELQRWNISESRLPAGSHVFYREPTLWEQYRRYVLATAAILLVQASLIAALVYERRVRRIAEAESLRSLAIAADVDRRAAMSALSGAVAHDLNQPLAAIRFNAEAAQKMIAARRALPEEIASIFTDILSSETRAHAIVQRHRQMLQRREFERRPVDMSAVARDAIALVAHVAKTRGVLLEDKVSGEPCLVLGDHVMLQQVVVNLLLNAMDAMIDTPVRALLVSVLDDVDEGAVIISVRDRGVGLPSGIGDRLFQPFYTSKADGVGIGLTIVHSIVQAHGGTVAAVNNPEGGATFSFRVPRLERGTNAIFPRAIAG